MNVMKFICILDMWLCISFPIHSFIHFIICNGFKSIWKLWKQFHFIVTVSMPLLSSLPFPFIVTLCFAFNGMLSLLFCFVLFCFVILKMLSTNSWAKTVFSNQGLICKATRYGLNIIWHTMINNSNKFRQCSIMRSLNAKKYANI